MMGFSLIKPLLVTAMLDTGAAQAAPDARKVWQLQTASKLA